MAAPVENATTNRRLTSDDDQAGVRVRRLRASRSAAGLISTALESKIWCVAASYGATRGIFQTVTSVLGVGGNTPGKARA